MLEMQNFEKHSVQTLDSREVAEMVEKQHKDLLRDIRGYIDVMERSTERNFRLRKKPPFQAAQTA